MKRFLLAMSVCTLPHLSSCELPTSGFSGPGPVPAFGAGVQPEGYGEPDPFVAAALQPNATGSARPSIQLGRNSSEGMSFQIDTAPLYNWRLNVSNVTLLPTLGPLSSLSTGKNLISGTLELILPETEIDRLVSQNKTLELKLMYTSYQADNASQEDDGSCLQVMGSTSAISNLLLDFLAVDPISTSNLIPESMNISRGQGYPALASLNVTSDFLDTSITPSSPGVTSDGFFDSVPDLRFLDFNGTASRASINHVVYGNATAAYYRSLRQILPIVVIERFLNPLDALNGTEIASMSCVRPRDVSPGSQTLPTDYWKHPEEALNVSSNDNNTQASGDGGSSAGSIQKVSSTLGTAAFVVFVLMQACA